MERASRQQPADAAGRRTAGARLLRVGRAANDNAGAGQRRALLALISAAALGIFIWIVVG